MTRGYLHLYELDGDDPEASFQAMATLMADWFGGRRTACSSDSGPIGTRQERASYCATRSGCAEPSSALT